MVWDHRYIDHGVHKTSGLLLHVSFARGRARFFSKKNLGTIFPSEKSFGTEKLWTDFYTPKIFFSAKINMIHWIPY